MKNFILLTLLLILTSCQKEMTILDTFPYNEEFTIIEVVTDNLALDLEECETVRFIQEPGLATQPNSWWTIIADDNLVSQNYWDGGSGIVPAYPDYLFNYGNGAWNGVKVTSGLDTIQFIKNGLETIVRVQTIDCIK